MHDVLRENAHKKLRSQRQLFEFALDGSEAYLVRGVGSCSQERSHQIFEFGGLLFCLQVWKFALIIGNSLDSLLFLRRPPDINNEDSD